MNPYELLEIAPGASPEEIKQAYHRLAKQWHPDRYTGEAKVAAEARFRQLAEAFGMLKDVVRKGETAPQVEPAPQGAQGGKEGAPVAAQAPQAPKMLTVEDWFRQGEDSLLKGDAERALGLAHYVLRLDGSRAEQHVLLANALEATGGDLRSQIKALESALLLSPQNPDLMLRLADLFEKVGMGTRASGMRDRARALQPDHPAFKAARKKGPQPVVVSTEPSLGEQWQMLVEKLKGAFGRLSGRK